jgi:hypothetical protein
LVGRSVPELLFGSFRRYSAVVILALGWIDQYDIGRSEWEQYGSQQYDLDYGDDADERTAPSTGGEI